ncbi:acyltransferase family protein [uncultured Jatrophihabitans sp.]|uniref:acyltransferase family protein n=1 Tax=uncultured Jatrophihabitans sp. TaxID=1610747 RepID=UPI0035CA40CE
MALTAPVVADAPPTSQSRLAYVDGLRAVAALWVVCNHAWLTIYPNVDEPTNAHGVLALLTDWMTLGHFAVVAFIVLSGYSLAISSVANRHRLRGGFWLFARRRFVRIVLPYWGALLISLALAASVLGRTTGTHWDSALPVTARGVLLHALLLQDVGTTGQINHALWSIALEWHSYFLFPLILLLRRRLGLVPATLAVVATAAVISAQFNGGLTLWAEANLIGCFALGVAAREIASLDGVIRLPGRRSVCPPWRLVTFVALAGMIAIVVLLGVRHGAQRNNALLEPLAGAATACLLIMLSRHACGWCRRALSWRPLVCVGTFSYSVYLLHAPLLQLVWQYVLTPLGLPRRQGGGLAALLVVGLAGSLAAGWGYWRLVERRCVRSGVDGAGEKAARRRGSASASPGPGG